MARIMMFADLSEHAQSVFGSEENYEGYKALSFDLARGEEILDENGNRMTKSVAEGVHLAFVRNLLGINENSTKRDRKRALKKHGDEFFAISEEIVDVKIETAFKENEFFNEFVEQRNIARGDSQEFWTDQKVYLSTVRTAGDFIGQTVQRLGSGESFTVGLETYSIAVGADIDLYIAGRLSWDKFTTQCAAAFVRQIQNTLYAEVMNVGEKLPAQFVQTGALSASTKDKFDTLIEDVQMANDGAAVAIVGTKSALKKIAEFYNGAVHWISEEQKRQMAATGRLGDYEGVTLIEIPQRFALNDTTNKLVDTTKLFILPLGADKFVKMVDQGETEIREITEKGARMDDTMFYSVERSFGVNTIISQYIGLWTLA